MRRFGIAATLLGVAVLMLAAYAWADVPNCDNCSVAPESSLVTTTPSDAAKATGRYVDFVVTVRDGSNNPIPDYDASNFQFLAQRHDGHPSLGCTDCEDKYTITCQAAATNQDGEMTVRADLGTGCSPSMCCPIQIFVRFPNCDMAVPFVLLMNSYDMVPSGKVDLSDIAAFGTALSAWQTGGTPQPCADFVLSPGAAQWGQLDLSDIAAFGVYIGVECTPFTNPCP